MCARAFVNHINHLNLWCLPLFIHFNIYHFGFCFKQLFYFSFFSIEHFQLVTVMDTRDVAVSIWNCINFRAVYRVVFAWIVDMQQLDVIATTAKKAIIAIHPNQLAIVKCASVSNFAPSEKKLYEEIHWERRPRMLALLCSAAIRYYRFSP